MTTAYGLTFTTPGHRRSDSGAEGIRTPDPLNAIEMRSQLRYSPIYSTRDLGATTLTLDDEPAVGLPCGAGGIRTPGLISAIDARSQLRYSPSCWTVYPKGE
jgi:hypothetical protein